MSAPSAFKPPRQSRKHLNSRLPAPLLKRQLSFATISSFDSVKGAENRRPLPKRLRLKRPKQNGRQESRETVIEVETAENETIEAVDKSALRRGRNNAHHPLAESNSRAANAAAANVADANEIAKADVNAEAGNVAAEEKTTIVAAKHSSDHRCQSTSLTNSTSAKSAATWPSQT